MGSSLLAAKKGYFLRKISEQTKIIGFSELKSNDHACDCTLTGRKPTPITPEANIKLILTWERATQPQLLHLDVPSINMNF